MIIAANAVISAQAPDWVKEMAAAALRRAQPQESSQSDDYLWLRDAARAGRLWFCVEEVGLNGRPPLAGAEVLVGDDAVRAAATALRRNAEGGRAEKLETSWQRIGHGRHGRIVRAISALERALQGGSDLPSEAEIVFAWADLIQLVEGKEALYRQYDSIKSGARELRQVAQEAIRRHDRRWLVRRVRRLILRAKRLLRQRPKPAQQPATTVAPVAPAPIKPVPVTAPVSQPQAVAAREPRLHRRGEKAAVVQAARQAAAAERAARKRREAEKKLAAQRRAARRGLVEALRRNRTAALKAQRAREFLPAVAAAVVQLLRQGVLTSSRAEALELLRELRAGVTPARLAGLVGEFQLGPRLAVMLTAWDAVDEDRAFELAVSAAAGGREYEQRLVQELRRLGAEVRTDRAADRRAGVDMLVLVDGREVAVQLTTMSWLAATTPSEQYARKRLESGTLVADGAVSKLQKDLEKFERRYRNGVPFVFVGVNATAPFTPEQYARSVLRLIQGQVRWLAGAAAFFFWAPDQPAIAVSFDGDQEESHE